jgi:excisionase family DNA binding protein
VEASAYLASNCNLEQLLTAREVAELLGFSSATVLDWHEAGKIPSFKIGHAVRFRLSEVLTWLEGQRTCPA